VDSRIDLIKIDQTLFCSKGNTTQIGIHDSGNTASKFSRIPFSEFGPGNRLTLKPRATFDLLMFMMAWTGISMKVFEQSFGCRHYMEILLHTQSRNWVLKVSHDTHIKLGTLGLYNHFFHQRISEHQRTAGLFPMGVIVTLNLKSKKYNA